MATPWKLGPHDQDGGEAAKSWARSANLVKACGNPAVLHEAPDHALRIWRWPFGQEESTRLLDQMAVEETAGRILSPLNGYTHPNLYLESLNEVPRQLFPKLVLFLISLQAELSSRGYKLTGPAQATGDYELEDIKLLRSVKLPLWTFHGYMTRDRGPTTWNAYRMRQFWLPGDPPVVYSEASYDRCRDGDLQVNEGYLPLGPGPYGWEYQFQGRPDPIAEAAQGLIHYARGLTEPWELGAVAFTTTPKPNWRVQGYDMDPLVPAMIREYVPWRPVVPGPNDWCPFADRYPLPDGLWDLTRDHLTTPYMICDHIADGNGNPGPWWETLLSQPPSKRASAHFWVSKAGKLVQYIPISGQAWSNGFLNHPDTSNLLIKSIVSRGVNPNEATISIEHEGHPGDQFTAIQTAVSRRLHDWLRDFHHIALNRSSVVGHYQFDSVTRARCPGPTFPWTAILGQGAQPMPPAAADTVRTITDAGWQLADQLQKLETRAKALNRPHLASYLSKQGEAIKDTMVMVGKGEM